MINVKVVPSREKICQEGIRNLIYYSCKHKIRATQRIFIACPPEGGRRLVIWLNSEFQCDVPVSRFLLGYDDFSILEEDYYDFQEIKDADLTFYV